MKISNNENMEDFNEDEIQFIGELDENNEFIPADDFEIEQEGSVVDTLEDYTCPKINAKLILTHPQSVFSIDFSPDNQFIVTGSQEDKACVWNATTGDLIFECSGHQESVLAARFNHNGEYLASIDLNGVVKVWKVETGNVIDESTVGTEPIWFFWHPSLNIMFAGCLEGQTYIWNLPMTNFKVLPSRGSQNLCSSLLPNGKQLAVGYQDGSVGIFDINTGKQLVTYKSKRQDMDLTSIECIDVHPDGNLIAVGIQSGHFALFKAFNGEEVSHFDLTATLEYYYITGIKFGCGSTAGFLALAVDDQIQIWDYSRKILRHTVKLHNEQVGSLAWTKDGGVVIVTGTERGHLYAIDGRTGEILKIYRGHKDAVRDLVISSDNKMLLSSSDDGEVHLFSLET